MFKTLILFAVLYTFCESGNPNVGKPDEKPSDKVIRIDPAVQESVVRNIFSDINVWDFRAHWTTAAAAMPDDFFVTKYPFVERVQFMTATGGNSSRDLFDDPLDTSVPDDYNFTPLIPALENVIAQGLKPMIKTGTVPLKYSTEPTFAAFGVNIRPPYDYDIYYNYIKALAEALVAKFGINEVKTWSWGVLTEYENSDWFEAADRSQSNVAFFKLYDYTVAALQDVIGRENLMVGAHSMTCSPGLWNEEQFIEHCANGTNYKTGATGTQVNFLAASYYDQTPGAPVTVNLSLANTIGLLKNKAEECGLTGLKFGIDEGRILNGIDGKPLGSRVVAHTFQASADAAMFKLMNDLGADWFSSWGLNSEDIWGIVDLVTAHVANLCYKMVGQNRTGFKVGNKSAEFTDGVDGMATYDPASNVLNVLVYNYNTDTGSTAAETPVIVIENVEPTAASVIVTQWVVDDTHGNFWPAWESDMKARGITSDSFAWSLYSTNIPNQLKSRSDIEYWRSRETEYSEMARMIPTTYTVAITDNTIIFKPTLEHHAVVFYRIENVRIAD